jgi:glucose-6-phosphate dehydrogenase assembly protein OpcA
MSAGSAQELSSHPPRQVAIDALEGELVKLWRHPEEAEEIRAHVTRACMSNLIVHHRPAEGGPETIDQMLIDVVRFHPCRILLLSEDETESSPEPRAFISAHVDSSQMAFSEQITLKTGGAGLARLPSIVRPFLLGDLPTSLWLSSGGLIPMGQDWFHELTEMADQMIYDSFIWSNARQGLISVTDWLAGAPAERSAADLAWRRLRPWRRLIAQALDPAAVPGALQAICEITIEHGPHALPQAWLLAGWMAQRLGWRPRAGSVTPGTEISWFLEAPAGPVKVTCRRLQQREFELADVEITWRDGAKTPKARFSHAGGGRLTVTYEGIDHPDRAMAVPRRTTGEMIARQLPDFGRDPWFDQALALARAMALAMEE